MSRAGDLRDAVTAELASALAVTVKSVMLPLVNPEDLDTGPLMTVRVLSRTVETMMGPDDRKVVIQCGLLALFPDPPDFQLTRDQRLAYELEQHDLFDGIIEQAIGLWSPNGPLSKVGLADHSFDLIEQPQTVDADLWYDYGIWGGPFNLTYTDSQDD